MPQWVTVPQTRAHISLSCSPRAMAPRHGVTPRGTLHAPPKGTEGQGEDPCRQQIFWRSNESVVLQKSLKTSGEEKPNICKESLPGAAVFPTFVPTFFGTHRPLPPHETPGRPLGVLQSEPPPDGNAGRARARRVSGGTAGPPGLPLLRVSASPIKARLIKRSRLRVGIVANPRDAAADRALRIFPRVQPPRATENPLPNALGRSRAPPPAPRIALPLSARSAPPGAPQPSARSARTAHPGSRPQREHR